MGGFWEEKNKYVTFERFKEVGMIDNK